jgi:signal transduction histidine kinase
MMALLRRLHPGRLTGQVTLVILASLIVYHVIWTLLLPLRHAQGRAPVVDPAEVLAGGVVALDQSPIADREATLAGLRRLSPWADFALAATPPAPAADEEAPHWREDVEERLWPGARAYPTEAAAGAKAASLAVELHKGGYALVRIAQDRRWPNAQKLARRRSDFDRFVNVSMLERWALLFMFLVSALIIWVSNSVAAPLVQLADASERLPDESGTATPLAESGPAEVRFLTRSLNRMQARIQALLKARSQALAAISHDMKTIITRVRLRAEFIADPAIREKMLADATLMDAMLRKNLEFLAGAERREGRSAIDLGSVLSTVADEFSDLGHKVDYRGGEHIAVFGALSDLFRIFNNLVENAVHHGENVVIEVDRSAAGSVTIDIIDDGPGVADADKARVVEPFIRMQPARNLDAHGGFGLGLSIVAALTAEAGGTLQLLDRKPRGLIARVTLPMMNGAGSAGQK